MVPTDDTTELELRDYLQVVRRRKYTIVASMLVVVVAALVVSLLQTPVYRAEATVLLQGRQSEEFFDPDQGGRTDASRRLRTEIEVIESEVVREAAHEALGREASISASPVDQTDVIALRARSTDPAAAAEVANTYAESYIEIRRRQRVEDLLAVGEELQSKIDDLQRQVDQLMSPVAVIDAQLQEATSAAERAELEERRQEVEADLAPRRDRLLDQQAFYRNQLDELQLAANLTRTGGAQVLTPATAPAEPVSPTPRRNAVVAAVLGLILGVGLAFLFEYLDDSVRTKEDLERATDHAPVLGLIPDVAAWKDRDEARVVSIEAPTSPSAEAYRTLRTSVQFLGLERPLGTVVVTSPNASEGKTTTLANLGVALARAGQRVAVVCCDLRRPRVHEFFGRDSSTGFTSVLLGEVPLSAALQEVEGEPGLRLLAAGPRPPNPSELLSSRRTAEVFTALQAEHDVVLVDAPPVLPVTDAIVLAGVADGMLLVATARMTSRRDTHRAVEVLGQVDAPLVGAVLNGVPPESSYGYRPGYGYGYGTYTYGGGGGRSRGRLGRRARRGEADGDREGDRAEPVPAEPLR